MEKWKDTRGHSDIVGNNLLFGDVERRDMTLLRLVRWTRVSSRSDGSSFVMGNYLPMQRCTFTVFSGRKQSPVQNTSLLLQTSFFSSACQPVPTGQSIVGISGGGS